MLSYNDLADESVKSVLNTLAGYEPNHKSPLFSINGAKDVTAKIYLCFPCCPESQTPRQPQRARHMATKTHEGT